MHLSIVATLKFQYPCVVKMSSIVSVLDDAAFTPQLEQLGWLTQVAVSRGLMAGNHGTSEPR